MTTDDDGSDLSRPQRVIITPPPPVFMRHPQPSEVQRGLSGGVYGGVCVIVMEGVINNNKMLMYKI